MRYSFYNCCVSWNPSDVDAKGGLCDMINSGRRIARATLRRNVGGSVLKQLETDLGYPMGRLTIAADWAVSYSKGKLHGVTVYWVNHSAIEYVFVPDGYGQD